MARRPKRPEKYIDDDIEIIDGSETLQSSASQSKPAKIKEFRQQLLLFFQNERVQIILGAVLAAFTLWLLIAFCSFFFTGKADFSILEQDGMARREMRQQIHNWTGLLGAQIIRLLIDSTFGIASLALLAYLFICAFRLMHWIKLNRWRTFFTFAFSLIWGSVTLSFIQYLTNSDSFFRWGGAHGETVCLFLLPYIQVVGLLLILIVTLIVFLIIIDPNTISNTKRFVTWLKNLFKKKQKTQTPPIEEDNNNDNNDDKKDENEEDNNHKDDDDIQIIEDTEEDIFDISSGDTEELVDETENKEDKEEDKEDPKEDPDLNINKPIENQLSPDDPDYILKKLGPYDPRKDLENYRFPSLSLLKVYDNETAPVIDNEEQQENKNRIIQALRSYGIEITRISATVGPTVTLYEIVPKEGIRVAKIKNLEDDIMMTLSAEGIRMIAPMPGKGTIGIEVPNKKPQIVSFHSVAASRKFQEDQKMRLPIVMGKTITNEVFMFDLAKTPHLLVAGATGQGKSVGLNAIITSLLYKKHPAELKFVLVDPKMVEFTIYKDLLKHYLAAMPGQEDINDIIITDCTKVINTLNSLVIEMENRYKLLMDANCRNLEDYNEKFINRRLNPEKGHRFLPYIVIVIDEFGDFIMQAGKEVERPIARITQKARAVGMHMILATQRPSVNIITGVIKANIPTRIAFRTQSMIDSRTVLDTKGAEGLVGKGDMLYSAGNGATRIQCAFVDTPEVIEIVKHIKQQQSFTTPYELPEYVPEGSDGEPAPGSVDLKKLDPMFQDIARYVVQNQQGSTSILQRKFQIGYNRAGKITDQLEAVGIVGPNNGPKGRQVLVQDEGTLEQILSSLN